ncbi:MAG: SipW-dependent-type signal peptide-containing protein [Lachnospiraceae bacterium]|nr:SipW-dependent-type signal peptide-containing protein [Lachnospiraceae bacterium]MBR4059170.1 SipW-dependent-type signal peptide-containing protein [Lachnospiraceae bacterium]
MKKTTKALALVLCAMLLVVGSVMGTLAYLTSTDEVTNTFTVGDIEIKLDEAKVDENGKALASGERTTPEDATNSYHILPGIEYDKDPTVWVKEGSEEAYIRMLVAVSNYDQMLLAFSNDDDDYDDAYIVTQASEVIVEGQMVVLDNLVDRDSSAWKCVKFTQDTTANIGTYEFRYYPGAYKATSDDGDTTVDYDKLNALFTTITVPEEIDNKHLGYLNNTKITITAQAIQAEGFVAQDGKTAEDMAWEAFSAN